METWKNDTVLGRHGRKDAKEKTGKKAGDTVPKEEIMHIGPGMPCGLGTLAVGDPCQGRSAPKPLEDTL